MYRTIRALAIPIILNGLTGCVSIGEVNAGMARIDRAWQLEYQQTEDEFRYRVVEADYELVLRAIRQTFLDLGMPIQQSSAVQGIVTVENVAPTPLTTEEWREVVRIEGPKTKEVGGWFMKLQEDPKDYIVTIRATVRPIVGGTLVLLEYQLDNPIFRSMGVQPSKHAPPLAVRLSTRKIWSQLEKRLSEVRAPLPRRRQGWETIA